MAHGAATALQIRYNSTTMTQLISTIAIAMGASWVSGINLYATVATLGLLGRFAQLQLPGELQVLTNWWVIGVAVVLYLIEFFADKIPYLDSTWDVIHTFIRIPAGAVLAATAFGDFDRSIQVIALLLGGGLAFSSHGTKAATRAMLNASPEPVSNVVASVVEDILAVVSVIVSVFAARADLRDSWCQVWWYRFWSSNASFASSGRLREAFAAGLRLPHP